MSGVVSAACAAAARSPAAARVKGDRATGHSSGNRIADVLGKKGTSENLEAGCLQRSGTGRGEGCFSS